MRAPKTGATWLDLFQGLLALGGASRFRLSGGSVPFRMLSSARGNRKTVSSCPLVLVRDA